MPDYSEIINQPINVVWEHLIYKIEHPEHFVPGVSNTAILEKTDNFVVRSMDLTLPDGSKVTVVEKITHSPYRVNYAITDHPVYTGNVENIAEIISANETRITFSMNWTHKNTGEKMNNPDIIKSAVKKTIDFILNK